jgi:hypothetical protein
VQCTGVGWLPQVARCSVRLGIVRRLGSVSVHFGFRFLNLRIFLLRGAGCNIEGDAGDWWRRLIGNGRRSARPGPSPAPKDSLKCVPLAVAVGLHAGWLLSMLANHASILASYVWIINCLRTADTPISACMLPIPSTPSITQIPSYSRPVLPQLS